MTNVLTRKYNILVIEDLNVAGMMASVTPKAQADAAMGEIRRQLEYKGPWRHVELIFAHRQYPSSKLCSSCQYHNAKLKRERYWTCPACRTRHEAHYGMDGWLAHTPIGAHFDLESTDIGAHDVALTNVPEMFRFVFKLGDTVNGLAWVDYDWMHQISSINFLFLLVLALRLFSIGMWLATAGALIKAVLDSNLLSSKVGLVVLFGGIGILSMLGILF